MSLETISTTRSYGGVQGVYRHISTATGTPMVFSVFLPPKAVNGSRCPVIWYLSGLTCTHANVTEKGEFRRMATELGLIIVCPDTSPRGADVADDAAWDLGQGAGFYVDATQAPWSSHFRMWTYVTAELPELVAANFPVDMGRQGITGHSMGGHGALTVALRHPGRFKSVSAFAPIVAPSRVAWGQKAFAAYLGDNKALWRKHDAVALIEDGARVPDLLVDQGTADGFVESQLRPKLLAEACLRAGISLTLRLQPDYDHSYYFISTFLEDHLRWHASRM